MMSSVCGLRADCALIEELRGLAARREAVDKAPSHANLCRPPRRRSQHLHGFAAGGPSSFCRHGYYP